jgi:Holliday junction resolvase
VSNPPKAKGTGFEREVMRALEEHGFDARRTSPGWPYDIDVVRTGPLDYGPIQALVTRPDRGEPLVTLPLEQFLDLLHNYQASAQLECKRYARFVMHTIYKETFG